MTVVIAAYVNQTQRKIRTTNLVTHFALAKQEKDIPLFVAFIWNVYVTGRQAHTCEAKYRTRASEVLSKRTTTHPQLLVLSARTYCIRSSSVGAYLKSVSAALV